MKNIVALILLQIAALMIGLAYHQVYGPPWAALCIPLHAIAAYAWVLAAGADKAAAAARFQAETAIVCEYLLNQAELSDPDAYHRDVVAVAYGEMDEEEFDRKWAGQVPRSPRQSPPRIASTSLVEDSAKRYAELAVSLAKATTDAERAAVRKEMEVVSSTVQNELLAAQLDAQTEKSTALFKELFADVLAELTRPDPNAKPTWTCKVTLGLHEDGPCQCIELASGPSVVSGPSALYRADQYVRYKERIWYVDRAVLCHGPQDMKWWAYYISREQEQLHPDEKDLTLALPNAGEVWEKQLCPKHPDPLPGCIRSLRVTDQEWYLCLDRADDVVCGCLRPVNYGIGFPPESFDPSKMPRVPGTGITYIIGTPRKERT